MKKLSLFSFILLLATRLFAQAPESFKYQAIIRDASGDIIADQTIGLQIDIVQGSETGTSVYSETWAVQTNAFGLVNLNIGEGNVQSGTFSSIDWGSDSYYVKISIDLSGGTSYTDVGTSQLLSVPYALHAKTAGNTASDIWDINGSDIYYSNGNVGIGTTNPLKKLHIVNNGFAEAMIESTGSSDAQFSFKSNRNANAEWEVGTGSASTASGDDFYVYKSLGTNGIKLVINDLGNVGIGTTTPNYKLDVDGEITSRSASAFRLRRDYYSAFLRNDDKDFWILLTDSADVDGFWNTLRPFRINLSSGDVYIGNYSLNVNHGGNVGIGTSTPSQKLTLSNGGIQLNQSYGIGFIGALPYNSDVSSDRAKYIMMQTSLIRMQMH